MCGNATLAIVLSTPCMIVASMIEAVIRARLAPALRSPPLTRFFLAPWLNGFLLAPQRPPAQHLVRSCHVNEQ